MISPTTRLILSAGLTAAVALSACNDQQNVAPPPAAPDTAPGSTAPASDNGSPSGSGMTDGSPAAGSSSSAMNPADATAMGPAPGAADSGRSAGDAVDDSWITAKVKAALAGDGGAKSSGIKVESRNGAITLSGTAPSTADAGRAEQLARGIKGVKSVDNRIEVAQQ